MSLKTPLEDEHLTPRSSRHCSPAHYQAKAEQEQIDSSVVKESTPRYLPTDKPAEPCPYDESHVKSRTAVGSHLGFSSVGLATAVRTSHSPFEYASHTSSSLKQQGNPEAKRAA